MGEVIEREALGETLILGTLFDARTSLMANGLSFWTPDTLETKGTLMDTVYSNVDVFMDNSIRFVLTLREIGLTKAAGKTRFYCSYLILGSKRSKSPFCNPSSF